jgi:FRG domain
LGIKTKKLKSVADLIANLKVDTAHKSGPCWFRGHSTDAWSLIPSYQRLKSPPPESVLRSRFKQNAHLLIPQATATDFDWMFIMQHYGVPTRLLDWTESPLAALYFTVCHQESKPGVLWALFPLVLNRLTTSKPEDVHHLPSFEDSILGNYSTLSVETNSQTGVLPMAVIATRNNPRIQAQLGVFTISHHTKQPIEEIGGGDHLVRYGVSADAKKRIREELKMLAVTKFQLFPELSSVGEIVREGLK